MTTTTASVKTISAAGYALLYGYGITALQAPKYADEIEAAMAMEGNLIENVADVFQQRLSFYSPATSIHAATLFARAYRK